MLSGEVFAEHRFHKSEVSEKKWSLDLKKLIRKMTNHNPDERYSSLDKVLEDLEKIEPLDAEDYLDRAEDYLDSKEYRKAIEDYEKAIELDPNYTTAYNNRGYAYEVLEEYEKAIEDYEKTIELDPNYTNAYYNQGSAYRNGN
jgi:tetratricopeptide (TPR) repeat protein